MNPEFVALLSGSRPPARATLASSDALMQAVENGAIPAPLIPFALDTLTAAFEANEARRQSADDARRVRSERVRAPIREVVAEMAAAVRHDPTWRRLSPEEAVEVVFSQARVSPECPACDPRTLRAVVEEVVSALHFASKR